MEVEAESSEEESSEEEEEAKPKAAAKPAAKVCSLATTPWLDRPSRGTHTSAVVYHNTYKLIAIHARDSVAAVNRGQLSRSYNATMVREINRFVFNVCRQLPRRRSHPRRRSLMMRTATTRRRPPLPSPPPRPRCP